MVWSHRWQRNMHSLSPFGSGSDSSPVGSSANGGGFGTSFGSGMGGVRMVSAEDETRAQQVLEGVMRRVNNCTAITMNHSVLTPKSKSNIVSGYLRHVAVSQENMLKSKHVEYKNNVSHYLLCTARLFDLHLTHRPSFAERRGRCFHHAAAAIVTTSIRVAKIGCRVIGAAGTAAAVFSGRPRCVSE